MSYTLRAKRVLVGAATGALVLGMLPAAALASMHEDVCENAPEGVFDDVSSDSTHGSQINCVGAYEIAVGVGDGDFNPQGVVRRGQMASFLVNTLERATGEELHGQGAESPFTDIEGTTHEENISIAFEQGITSGVTETTYEPNVAVSRGQMATMVAGMIEAAGGELPGADDVEDAFTDDDGNIHEDSINRLAAAGIVVGVGDGEFNPGGAITRAQMATYLAHSAGVLNEQGQWAAELEPQPGPNQSLTVTPQSEATITIADESVAPSTGDDRQFSVTGLDDEAEYVVQLSLADDVAVDEAGVVTFADNAVTDVADLTAPAAELIVVNGAPAANVTRVEVAPVNGAITFTIDGEAFESVVPVVYLDEDADGELNLEDGEPTEPFGIGGVTHFMPMEAADGTDFTGATQLEVIEVFRDSDSFVGNDGGDDWLLKYDSNDEFTVDGAQATLATFEAAIDAGDLVDVADYQSDPELKSTFELTNVAPDAPVIDGATSGERTIQLDLSGIEAGATVTVYYDVDGNPGTPGDPALDTDAFESQQFDADEDDVTPGYQVTITGLVPDENYEIYVIQTVNNEDSPAANTEESTNPDDVPTVDTVIANDINDGVGSTNEILVTFSEEVTILDVSGFEVEVGGFTLTGTNAVAANDARTRYIITLDGTLNDAPNVSDVTYDLNVAAASFEDVSGQENVAAEPAAQFDY